MSTATKLARRYSPRGTKPHNIIYVCITDSEKACISSFAKTKHNREMSLSFASRSLIRTALALRASHPKRFDLLQYQINREDNQPHADSIEGQ